jgi:3alpha(or 20beta)-hydroxysteroid dehydrogenase
MTSYIDRTVVITGGTGGMGSAIAAKFAAEGARVIVGDVGEEAGNKLVAQLGEPARFAKLDVSDEADWRAIAAQIESWTSMSSVPGWACTCWVAHCAQAATV